MGGCLAEVKKEALCKPLRWTSFRLANWPEARQTQGADLGGSCHCPVASSQLPCHYLCTALSFPQGSATVPAQRSSFFLIKKQLMGALLPDSCLLPLLGPAHEALPWDVATVMSTPHLGSSSPHFPKSSPVTAGPRPRTWGRELGMWVQEDAPCLHLCDKASGLLYTPSLRCNQVGFLSLFPGGEGRVRAKSEDEN